MNVASALEFESIRSYLDIQNMEFYTVTDYTILGLAVIFLANWWILWFIHMVAIIHASRRLYRYL